MTHEMLRSDAPWAIALMLMLLRPSAPNTSPATPGRPFIPSPTTARIICPGFSSIAVRRLWNSKRNSSWIACTAAAASAVCTAKQIVCSDDACEIRMTLTWRAASARNSRSAIPGTPTIVNPRIVSSVRSPTELIPFAGCP